MICLTTTSLLMGACGPLFTNGTIEYLGLKLLKPDPDVSLVGATENNYEVGVLVRTKIGPGMNNYAHFFACADNSNKPDSWGYEDTKTAITLVSVLNLNKNKADKPKLVVILPELGGNPLLMRVTRSSATSNWPLFKWAPKYAGKPMCVRIRSATTTHWYWTSAMRIDDILAREGLIAPE